MAHQPDDILIRPLESLGEIHAAEDLQRRVWHMDTDLEVISVTLLVPLSKNGGIVLGAFDGSKLVGLVLGFVGRGPDGEVYHWSHMNGVLEEYRGLGVGEQLKWAQRQAALKQGLELMRWTFDPLEGRNAWLNIGKLGATAGCYERNVYGAMMDGLNVGLESDRVIAEWELRSAHVEACARGESPPLSMDDVADALPINPTVSLAPGLRRPVGSLLDADAPRLLLEIPADFQSVKRHDLALAATWRAETRRLFEAYFGRGYRATGFLTGRGDEHRNFYLLTANTCASGRKRKS
jgi:chorismate synthase